MAVRTLPTQPVARRTRRQRPRSEPKAWRRGRVARRWRRGIALDPRTRRRKGAPTVGARLRRLLWTWQLWAGAAVVLSWRGGSWGWTLAAVLLAVVCFLLTPREAPPQYGLDHEFDADSEEFLTTMIGATGVPFVEGNHIRFLNNGDEFYPAMLHDIAQARHAITVEAYIYWAGDIGLRFANALAERARSGVIVKILLDAVGSSTIGNEILEILQGGGCHLAWYNPIRWKTLGRYNHRTHRKSLIIDGAIGYTGGAGIADHWMGHAQDADHWRDMQVRIEGPAVVPLQSGFAHNWLQSTEEVVSGFPFYPSLAADGAIAAQTLMSSPETGASSVRLMYYMSIAAAQRYIVIANPYFVPDQVASNMLVEARRRGVDVTVMVAGVRNDAWLARYNSVRLLGTLLEAGIGILEYNRTMLHHKIMVVDGVWATIGTTNFDNRSFAHNEETNVCVRDPRLADELHEIFLRDAAQCERLTLERWRRRGAWSRAQEFVASLLQEQA